MYAKFSTKKKEDQLSNDNFTSLEQDFANYADYTRTLYYLGLYVSARFYSNINILFDPLNRS